MTQAIVDPGELRRFAQMLRRFNEELNEKTAAQILRSRERRFGLKRREESGLGLRQHRASVTDFKFTRCFNVQRGHFAVFDEH